MVTKIHEASIKDPEDESSGSKSREIVENVANGLLLYRRIKNSIQKKDVGMAGKMFIVFKYLFMHDLIPYEKEIIAKILPVNVKFIEFLLVMLRIRQYYYDTVIGRPIDVIKKLFPTFFLISSRLIGHRELDILVERLTYLKKLKGNCRPQYGNRNLQLIEKFLQAGRMIHHLKKSKL